MGAVAAEAPAGGGGVHACVRERERRGFWGGPLRPSRD